MNKLIYFVVYFIFGINFAIAENISIISPFSPGSSTDLICRELVNILSVYDKDNTYIVENKAGAQGALALNYSMETNKPNVAVIITPYNYINPNIYEKYDVVSPLILHEIILVVNRDFGFKTLKEFRNYLSTKKTITYGTVGLPGAFVSSIFLKNINSDSLGIYFKNHSDAEQSLLKKEIDFIVTDPVTATNGLFTPLATSLNLKSFTGVQSFKDQGFDVDIPIYIAFVVKKNINYNISKISEILYSKEYEERIKKYYFYFDRSIEPISFLKKDAESIERYSKEFKIRIRQN